MTPAVGTRYIVLRPLLGLDVGDEVECFDEVRDPHASATIYSLRRVADGTVAHLTELADEHLVYLRALDAYLRRVS